MAKFNQKQYPGEYHRCRMEPDGWNRMPGTR